MTALLAVLIALSPDNTAPPTPEIPPPLPTYIVNGDGSRMNCTPTYSYCWPGQP
ncbi:hypothetical protein SEA_PHRAPPUCCINO_187 [Mycobacterium phage Phrappuccino]|uniref:Uncharacterized protein n=1 Tax=Mycobacterium phage Phrappuccino TaxID=2591223 RepID=A0A514DE24_9CAUD|nr:hypothetical protein KHQ87_gp187 [Mycobacterium phage Phrappuccino]QDH91862.1 hypothetical protein SEA_PHRAPPUCCINO_187 [Mycobacterium phage Phrappuccino]QIQ63328.1 hypothetical protein SEA_SETTECANDELA_212 [Mycobacterium phage Settecandela]